MLRLLALILAHGILTGCAVVCNAMYSPDGVMITLEGGEWTPGAWVVEVGGERCSVVLPNDGSGVTCDEGDPRVQLEVYLTQELDAIDSAWLMESTPDPLDIRLSRDGTVVHEESLSPSYVVDEPNGEGCGERQTADVVVTLD